MPWIPWATAQSSNIGELIPFAGHSLGPVFQPVLDKIQDIADLQKKLHEGHSSSTHLNGHYFGISIPSWLSSLIFLSLFGFVVSRGIRITDHLNRLLMLMKAGLFFTILMGLSAYFKGNTIPLSLQIYFLPFASLPPFLQTR